jgi:hypothetical protein
MDKFLSDRKHYLDNGEGKEGKAPAKLPKGEGSDRGGKPAGNGKLAVSKAMMNDPDKMSAAMSKIASAGDGDWSDAFEFVD